MNSTAWRLPSVMVPVLSSSSVFTSPAASTALPLMASTLCCITRSMPAMPMAESRPPMVVGNQADQQRNQHGHAGHRARAGRSHAVQANGCRVTTASRKISVKPGDQDVERDLVGRLLALGAFDQRDHAVQEGFARDWR